MVGGWTRIAAALLITWVLGGTGPAVAQTQHPPNPAPETLATWDCQRNPEPAEQDLSQFLNSFCHLARGWAHDNRTRLVGPVVDDTYYSVHGMSWVVVYYSPEVYTWLLEGRPEDDRFPEGAMIVKEQYSWSATGAGPGDLEGWTVMLKDPEASYDGWYWAWIGYRTTQHDDGEFYLPYCVGCHASSDRPQLTFSALENITGGAPEPPFTPDFPPNTVGGDTPLPASAHDAQTGDLTPAEIDAVHPLPGPDPAFVATFPFAPQPTARTVQDLPPDHLDHVLSTPDGPDQFISASVCGGCHDADGLLANRQPAMFVDIEGTFYNFSMFGEWRASVMGLAGRDPVFYAQLESERALQPDIADLIDDTCLSCHAAPGQRQFHIDRANGADLPEFFTHEMVLATPPSAYARYGALARDGISCTVCHHMTAEGLGTPATFTGRFHMGPADEVYGPFEDVAPYSMEQAMGLTPMFGAQIADSAMCGSCHTIVLPVLEAGGDYTAAEVQAAMARQPEDQEYPGGAEHCPIPLKHEQATYLEWANSGFWNPADETRTTRCQDCHMNGQVTEIAPFSIENPLDLDFQIANIQDAAYPYFANTADPELIDIPVREDYSRHTFNGGNLFMLEMARQMPEVLGITLANGNIPTTGTSAQNLDLSLIATAHQIRQWTASIAVAEPAVDGDALVVDVTATNQAGHKFPSGVGFRRAFVELSVLDDAGGVLWASGRVNALGLILGADGRPLPTELSRDAWQPHYETITSADQAQIYEERTLDSAGQLTTSFLARSQEVKENRLLPRGWLGTAGVPARVSRNQMAQMQPCQVAATNSVGLPADAPCAPLTDPDYQDNADGSDSLTYRIPLAEIDGWARVEARLHYQTLPPYYLQDRFTIADGPATQRLYYLTSRLNTADTPIDNWTITVAETAASR